MKIWIFSPGRLMESRFKLPHRTSIVQIRRHWSSWQILFMPRTSKWIWCIWFCTIFFLRVTWFVMETTPRPLTTNKSVVSVKVFTFTLKYHSDEVHITQKLNFYQNWHSQTTNIHTEITFTKLSLQACFCRWAYLCLGASTQALVNFLDTTALLSFLCLWPMSAWEPRIRQEHWKQHNADVGDTWRY